MQSFATYLKRVTLIALLAILGYGIGIALRSADSTVQAKDEQACNENECVKATHPETKKEFGICSYEHIENKNCKNIKETENCEHIDCD